MSKNHDAYRKLLKEQQEQIELLYTNIEIARAVRTLDNNKKIINIINEMQQEGTYKSECVPIGTLRYSYALKEFLELKTKILFDGLDVTDKELKFLDYFESFQQNRITGTDEAKEYIKHFIESRYQTQIDDNEYPDLESIKAKLDKNLEDYDKKHQKTPPKENKKVNMLSDLEKMFFVDTVQVRILYSIQCQIIQYDIKNTKDCSAKCDKIAWLCDWKKHILDSLNIQSNRSAYFINDENFLYDEIKYTLGLSDENSWMDLIALECVLFKPYMPLSDDKDSIKLWKKKHLKLKTNYLSDIFCKKQNYITESKINKFKKTYKKYINAYNNTIAKTAIGIASTIVLIAATGGVASAFAPEIAVALVGSSFTLSGAALTNASLALIGGGALAVGGFGMAGGTALITGGGVLIGAIGSGLSTTVLSLLSVEGFGAQTSAMLLTFCDNVIRYSSGAEQKLNSIQEALDNNIHSYNELLSELRKKADKIEDKIQKKKLNKDIRVIQDNIKCVEKCKAMLIRMIKKDEKEAAKIHENEK